jgi:hypothetical protein
MSFTDARGGVELTLSARGAGFAAIQKCLELHSEVAPLTPAEKLFGVSPLAQNARSWYLGALGEIVVSEKLEQLGEDWHVINGLPAGVSGSDIDHVVVGPAGVFTINMKAHAEKKVRAAGNSLRLNGFKFNSVGDAQLAAASASKLLTAAVGRPITVTPLIVMVGLSQMHYGVRRREVDVVTSSGIVRYLRRRKRVLSGDAIAEIADVAGRRGTWHRDGVVLDDSEHLVQRFESLRHEVDAAAATRKVWSILGKLVVVLLGFWVCAHLVEMVAAVVAGSY